MAEASRQEIAPIDWSELIPEEEWVLHRAVLDEAKARQVRFALGGGLAFSAYTRRLRNTKDMDLYVLPEERDAMIEATRDAGYKDYYEEEPYDREWIYRGYRDDVIVDVIWKMANYRAEVDEAWLTRGPEVEIRDTRLRLLPPEELIWAKLYVVHRDRSDWPDLLNVLYAVGPELDWEHLLSRVGQDVPVLAALMSLFGWLCPTRAREFPEWIWERMHIAPPAPGPDCQEDRHRIELIDTRDWFGPPDSGE
ncbi:MAG: nucleotidyltransferase family protein [Chloroflexota bacterium]|nr:nucleotidyltransferase family protein [Chloroflexota bacterium]